MRSFAAVLCLVPACAFAAAPNSESAYRSTPDVFNQNTSGGTLLGGPEIVGPALTSFTGGSAFATFQADGDTIGWSFTVDRPIFVTHLGYYDGDATLNIASHPVGLWNSSGTLLTSNVVLASSPLTSGFRYEPTAVVEIGPGTTYHLGAFVAANNTLADAYYTSTTARTLAAGFTGVAVLRDPDGAQTGLVFPSVVTTPWTGRFGPNLLFDEIPEPGTLGIAAGAATGVFLRRRRD